ncbi:Lipase [Purpureocillium lilacinum]|uniref:Lipase n=1 Tax=Purpureocillium lilacinum TaxID=33203 RepID=A0A179GX43_PURLI|nr:Lipase [Purpureocillium lilacinum]
MAQTLNDSDGLANLRNLAQEVQRIASADKSIPIVFVPGFSGWGAPLFGAINYFGGEIDIPKLLVDEGYTVIVAPVAPISTNWERACELYRLLTFGQFSTVNPITGVIDEVYDVDIDYGTYFAGVPHAPDDTTPTGQTMTTGRRRAILYSNSPNFRNWSWGRKKKVHFVCHSQGGNTVRYLISLMANGAGALHPAYFSERSRQRAVGLVARYFATASFYAPERRAYDLQLDHWGIRRNAGETFQDMLDRMEAQNGPVWKWLNSDNNGLYDNSIEGVHNLSQNHNVINTSAKIFYFSLSFHATDPFPEAWPPWINAFAAIGWGILMAITSFRQFVEWVTGSVITRILQGLGYDLVLPNPGRYLPRQDVIPILLPSVYAMGSHELSQQQKNILGPNLGDWYQNDGVVNTESMIGPGNTASAIGSLPDFDFSIAGKRGIYWHLGVNSRMDHADEIGVFIDQNTVRLQIPWH